jgi:hypothetical protein
VVENYEVRATMKADIFGEVGTKCLFVVVVETIFDLPYFTLTVIDI